MDELAKSVYLEGKCPICGRGLIRDTADIQTCYNCQATYKPSVSHDEYGGRHTSFDRYTVMYEQGGVGWLLYTLEKRAHELRILQHAS